ncbi:hypothetical protein [Parabacteroides sp. AM08-6]|uniref:type IV toxin-antitoxin system AbiEi family antitoxin domain-containing protein n=1 Tax=Parabacteroides sp. AM08-6 TaxID=2292053 RepID=UPI000F0035D3|nr:hypothetical protein [Parabacteroides sp. AM08-6]RHJ80271.1 hypothetical protein DW103_12540 [Parabacteroides sp. AM08-6]
MPKYDNDIQDKRFVSGKEMFSGIRNRETVSSLLYRYRTRNMIVRVRKNVYLPVNPGDGYVDENKFEIGCSAVPESYISYHSAMEYYGWQNQVFNRIYLSAVRRFRPFEFDFVEYMYAPDKFREGIVRPHPDKKVHVTDPERTIIDCADRLDLAGGYEEYVYNLNFVGEADEGKLLHYLSLYGKQALNQRAGFILSLFKEKMKLSDRFFRICREKAGKSTRYLTVKGESDIYVSQWKICVPRYLMELTR